MNQVKDQSYDEKFDMYMDCDKEDLVRMLIEANNHIDNLGNLFFDDSPPSDEAIEWAESVIEERLNEDE